MASLLFAQRPLACGQAARDRRPRLPGWGLACPTPTADAQLLMTLCLTGGSPSRGFGTWRVHWQVRRRGLRAAAIAPSPATGASGPTAYAVGYTLSPWRAGGLDFCDSLRNRRMGARHESGVRGVFGVARAYPVRQTRPQDEILPYIAASRKRCVRPRCRRTDRKAGWKPAAG